MGGTVSTRIVGKSKQPADTQALDALDKMNESIEILEKREKLLEKKANAELERAKEFTKLKNKKAAMQSLKMKKMYENQIAQMGSYKMRLYDQMFMVDNAKATTETLGALKVGAETMKAMQKATKMDDIETTFEEINEQNETVRQIQDALSAPIGMTAEIDDEDLLGELNDMEQQELQEKLELDLLGIGPPSRIEPYVRASNPQYQEEESEGKQPLAVMADGVTSQPVREGRKQPVADQMVGEKIFQPVQEGLPQAYGSPGKQPIVEELRHQKSVADGGLGKLKAEMLLDQGSYPPYGQQAVQPAPQTTSQREDSNKLKKKMQSTPQKTQSEDEQIEKIKKEMQLAA